MEGEPAKEFLRLLSLPQDPPLPTLYYATSAGEKTESGRPGRCFAFCLVCLDALAPGDGGSAPSGCSRHGHYCHEVWSLIRLSTGVHHPSKMEYSSPLLPLNGTRNVKTSHTSGRGPVWSACPVLPKRRTRVRRRTQVGHLYYHIFMHNTYIPTQNHNMPYEEAGH